jgi:hypothetical protein
MRGFRFPARRKMRSSISWEFTQRRFIFVTDVSEQRLGHIFKGQEVKEDTLNL